MRGERYFVSEDSLGLYLSSSGLWYGDSGMTLRSLVFLCFGANTTTYSFLAPEWC